MNHPDNKHIEPFVPNAQVRERLLDAAEMLFAGNGFAGTSVRDITAQASCNLASVNYYFGSKHNLYLHVFRRRLEIMKDLRIASLRKVIKEAKGRITLELVLSTFANAFLEPFMAESKGRLIEQLIQRELTDPQLPTEQFTKEMFEPVYKALEKAISEAEPGLDGREIRLCIHSFIGQLVHVLHLQSINKRNPGIEIFSHRLSELIDHTVRFSAAGMRNASQRERR